MNIKKLLKEITTSRTYKYIVTIGLAHATIFLLGIVMYLMAYIDSLSTNQGDAAVFALLFIFAITAIITVILTLIALIILLVDLFKPVINGDSDFLPAWLQIISLVAYLIMIILIFLAKLFM